jgi:hypothetical protein
MSVTVVGIPQFIALKCQLYSKPVKYNTKIRGYIKKSKAVPLHAMEARGGEEV